MADNYNKGILGDSLNYWESKINRIIGAIDTFINVPLNNCRRRFEGHFLLVYLGTGIINTFLENLFF